MSDTRFGPPWNFLGLETGCSAPERSRAWVMPVPYEATTTYGPGTRNGPKAIIEASRQMDTYDREFDGEPAELIGFHTLDPVSLVRTSPEAMVAAMRDVVASVLVGTPRPEVLIILGGEHSISPGVVKGLAAVRGGDDLVCVQIDAHADLRDEYEGSKNSHACAARRIVETCPIFQIAIRSISEPEDRWRLASDRVTTWFDDDVRADPRSMLRALGEFVRNKTVFLTVDLDGLDPAIMPAVGTPEPGGLDWHLTLDIARTIAREAASVPAFDVVELAPLPGMLSPEALAARLAYKIASLIVLKRGPQAG